MVGGVVKEVLWRPGVIWVNCVEQLPCGRRTECAIYVERNATSERIRAGDQLWWQGRSAMWTPQENRTAECDHRDHVTCMARGGIDYDIIIPRFGYSGAIHPGQGLIERSFGENER